MVAQRLADGIDKPRTAPPAEQYCGMTEGFIVVSEIRPKRVFASLAFDVLWVGNDLTVVNGASCWKKLPGFVPAVRMFRRFM